MRILFILSFLISLNVGAQNTIDMKKAMVHFANAMNTGDTTGVRELFEDSVYYYNANELSFKTSKEEIVGTVYIAKILERFYYLDSLKILSDSTIEFVSKEFPSYSYRNCTSIDTINYKNTFYFKNNKIYKKRIDTLSNRAYSYVIEEKISDAYYYSFLDSLSQNDSNKYNRLMDLSEEIYLPARYDILKALRFESYHKKLFLEWEKKQKKIIEFEGWDIEVPISYKDTFLSAYCNDVGELVSKQDSLVIRYEHNISINSREYKIRHRLIRPEDSCTYEMQLKKFKRKFNSPYSSYMESYGDTNQYKVYYDTLGNNIMQVIFPLKREGLIMVTIEDCRNQEFIQFWAKGLGEERKKDFLEIVKSVRFTEL